MRLAEAEAKLKTEVARLKKKYQAQITELELSLDAANKANIDLQKTIKRQALQITVRYGAIQLSAALTNHSFVCIFPGAASPLR